MVLDGYGNLRPVGRGWSLDCIAPGIAPSDPIRIRCGKEATVQTGSRARDHRSQGFTLIELMVVVSIIVIVSAASIPVGLNFVRQFQVSGAASNVAAQVQMARGQAVKRNTQRGILLNFNFPQATQYQFTSLDPSPVTGAWDGGVYPNFAPRTYQEGMINFGAVPAPPNNTVDPDAANGVMSPHGTPFGLPGEVLFVPQGVFNALLFRADGSVRAVNVAGGGLASIVVIGVEFEVRVRDPRTNMARILRITRNGRVTIIQ
jgi:prepilin-type N-terminal cleavage/methylation domain-containing protein